MLQCAASFKRDINVIDEILPGLYCIKVPLPKIRLNTPIYTGSRTKTGTQYDLKIFLVGYLVSNLVIINLWHVYIFCIPHGFKAAILIFLERRPCSVKEVRALLYYFETIHELSEWAAWDTDCQDRRSSIIGFKGRFNQLV